MSGETRASRRIRPASRAEGRLELPGDKSISHRLLLLAAVAEGDSRIENLGRGEDVASTRRALAALGCTSEEEAPGRVVVRGRGWAAFQGGGAARGPVDCGNSGTTARLLAGLVAARPGVHVIDGDLSLRSRPMHRVAAPLALLGAKVESPGTLPMTVRGGALAGARIELPLASAQVKGAVVLAALQARGESIVVQRSVTRDHTERLAAALGGAASWRPGAAEIRVGGGSRPLSPWRGRVPGDLSAAAYFAALAAALPGSRVEIADSSVNPSRMAFFDALRAMGAHVEIERRRDGAEPSGNLTIEGRKLKGIALDPSQAALAVDEIPLLALIASRAEGATVLRGLSELRVKESDRLRAIERLLTLLGARYERSGDDLRIVGVETLRGGEFDPQGDHRMAMTAAIAGALSRDGVAVMDPGCVAISHPGFFGDLERIAHGAGAERAP